MNYFRVRFSKNFVMRHDFFGHSHTFTCIFLVTWIYHYTMEGFQSICFVFNEYPISFIHSFKNLFSLFHLVCNCLNSDFSYHARIRCGHSYKQLRAASLALNEKADIWSVSDWNLIHRGDSCNLAAMLFTIRIWVKNWFFERQLASLGIDYAQIFVRRESVLPNCTNLY